MQHVLCQIRRVMIEHQRNRADGFAARRPFFCHQAVTYQIAQRFGPIGVALARDLPIELGE